MPEDSLYLLHGLWVARSAPRRSRRHAARWSAGAERERERDTAAVSQEVKGSDQGPVRGWCLGRRRRPGVVGGRVGGGRAAHGPERSKGWVGRVHVEVAVPKHNAILPRDGAAGPTRCAATRGRGRVSRPAEPSPGCWLRRCGGRTAVGGHGRAEARTQCFGCRAMGGGMAGPRQGRRGVLGGAELTDRAGSCPGRSAGRRTGACAGACA